PHNHRSGRGDTSRRSAQLPAFCRSRSSRSQLVSVSNLRNLQRLLLLVLLFQLSTLLLVIVGPMPPRPQVSTSPDMPRHVGTAGDGPGLTPQRAER
ncbi:MAG: hypothetical protein ACK5GZ_16545, partial [Cyanobium sp.]